ncbi:hypothetical protein F0U60_40095 [Archangium minus]|uniref:Uncharacterized protein n=1 Tax=Archangium minus TaxID=83450 RepID=A0ABY9X2N9_9BACT|nr:hypothetical protein F0U60_40095 [Archangium minus]
MPSREEKLRAICLLVEGEEDVDGERLRFFQSIVIYALDFQDAERRVTVELARRGASLISIDPEETREVEPDTVKFGGADPEAGIVGKSGRIWVKPGLFRRIGSRLRRIWH